MRAGIATSECLSLGFGKRPDASPSHTCTLVLRKRDLAAPTVMPKTHAVSTVLRFLTSRRKSTSRYFRGRASIARRSVSPNFFLLRAAQAISRQSVKSFAIFPDRDLRPSVRLVASAAKTFSKLTAVTGSVFALIPVWMSRAAKSSTRKADFTDQLSGSHGVPESEKTGLMPRRKKGQGAPVRPSALSSRPSIKVSNHVVFTLRWQAYIKG